LNENEFPKIEALEARKKDGSLYYRQPEVIDRLRSLEDSSYEDICSALKQSDENHADYIPTECLLAIARSLRLRTKGDLFAVIWRKLMERAIR